MENNLKYSKIGSAGSKGVKYQVNLLTIVLLNAFHNLSGTRWKLSTENEKAGKFDDVVFEGPEGDILLQAKSKENKRKRVKLEDILSTNFNNDDFSLPKYFCSYFEIKNKFRVKNVILCTNAEVHETLLKFLTLHIDSMESLLHIENSFFYTFNEEIVPSLKENIKNYFEKSLRDKMKDQLTITDENIKEFLKKIQFYSSYPSKNNFEKHIQQLMSILKSTNNFFCKVTFQDIHNKVKEWFEQPKGEHLTESRTKVMLCDIRSRKYSEKLESYNVLFVNNDFEAKRLKQITHVAFKSGGILLHVLRLYQALKNEELTQLYVNPEDGAYDQMQIIEAFEQSNHIILVIIRPKITEFPGKEICEKLNEILIRKTYKKLILVAESDDALAQQIVLNKDASNYDIIRCSVTFGDLSGETQDMLLKKKNVNFQGTIFSLEETLGSLEKEEFKESLCAHTLESLIENKEIVLGSQVQPLSEDLQHYYIHRKFKRRTIGTDEIYPEEDIFAVNQKLILITDFAGMGKSTVLKKLAIDIKKNNQHMWVIRIDLNNCSGVLKEFVRKKRKTIELEELLDSLDFTKFRTQFEKYIFSVSEKVVLLLDGVDEISPYYTTLIASLLIRCQEAANLAKVFVTTRPHVSQQLQGTLRITPFVLEPFTEENQVEFLINYWTHHLKLESEDINKCETYAKILIDKMFSWIHLYSWENRFAWIPLLLRMLAEIFEQSNKLIEVSEWEGCKEYLSKNVREPKLPKKMNILKLYEMLVEKKLDVFLEKANPSGNAISNMAILDQFNECLYYHEIVAIEVIFGKTVCQFFTSYQQYNKNFENQLLNIGIVQKLNDRLQFIHRTFAEYFVAKGLVRELQNNNTKVDFEDFLIRNIVSSSNLFRNLQFFDSCLEKIVESLPANLFCNYQAVTYEIDKDDYLNIILIIPFLVRNNMKSILQLLLKSLDVAGKGYKGRTEISISHFFSSNMKCFCNQSKTQDNIFNILQSLIKECGLNIKGVDGRTPLHIAVKEGYLEMVTFLVNKGADIVMKDFEGCTPLFLAASQGQLEIVQFLMTRSASYYTEIIDNVNDGTLSTHDGHLDTETLLAVKKCIYINTKNDHGDTALHQAILNKHLNTSALLLEFGADTNIKNDLGNTALHEAVSDMQLVELLLKYGTNVDIRNNNGETALHQAVIYRHLDVVKLLLENSADINIRNKSGDTPLINAASKGYLDIVHFLVECGAKINVQNNTGNTALHEATSVKHLPIIKFLVNQGANIDIENKYGDKPIHASHMQSNNFMIIQEYEIDIKNKQSVRFLKKFGLELDVFDNGFAVSERAVSDEYLNIFNKCEGITTIEDANNGRLYRAASDGYLNCMLNMEKHVDVKIHDENDTTLHRAASEGHLDMIKLSVENGININIQNKHGDTMLLKAASHGYMDIVKLLVGKGAELDIKNRNGNTALHRAVSGGYMNIVKILVDCGADVTIKNIDDDTPLHDASSEGFLLILRILTGGGVDVNLTNSEGNTPLHEAAAGGFLDIVTVLIERNADADIKNKNGNTALHVAASWGYLGIVKLLVRSGARINVKNISEDTALHEAVSKVHVDVVSVLLNCGADVTIKNKEGNTSLHIAALKGYLNIVELFMKHEANIKIKNNENCMRLHSSDK